MTYPISLSVRTLSMLLLACSLWLASAAGATQAVDEDKRVFGWLENVMLDPERGFLFKAKLDTGADTSSLHAFNVRRVRRGEQRYVRFHVEDPETGERFELVRQFVRSVRIKRHGGQHQRRVVVLMNVCLGRHARAIEVNLVDRGVFDYPMLLGRSALDGVAMVDPERTFTSEPGCWDLEAARAAAAREAIAVRSLEGEAGPGAR